jgi:hypothetical protein
MAVPPNGGARLVLCSLEKLFDDFKDALLGLGWPGGGTVILR